MLDFAEIGKKYDAATELLGKPISCGLFDRRLLFPRSTVTTQIEKETGQRLTLEQIDQMERSGLFAWLPGAGESKSELGIPLYMPGRIGLFSTLITRGWSFEELRDCAEWEEWLIDDSLEAEGSLYLDSDLDVLERQFRFELEHLEAER